MDLILLIIGIVLLLVAVLGVGGVIGALGEHRVGPADHRGDRHRLARHYRPPPGLTQQTAGTRTAGPATGPAAFVRTARE